MTHRDLNVRCIGNDLQLFCVLKRLQSALFIVQSILHSISEYQNRYAVFYAERRFKLILRDQCRVDVLDVVPAGRSLMGKVEEVTLTLFQLIKLFFEFGHFFGEFLFLFQLQFFFGKTFEINLRYFCVFSIKFVKFFDWIHDRLVISLHKSECIPFSSLLSFSL